MQEAWVQSLIREDPTGHGATESLTTTSEPELKSPGPAITETHTPRACALQQEELFLTTVRNPRRN